MAKKITAEDKKELYRLLVSLSNEQECESLLEDLCTIREVEQMAERVRAAKMLALGKTYTEIINETDISSATLSRISRSLQYGSGYSKFLK